MPVLHYPHAPLLTEVELAKVLQVHPETLRHYRKKGLPHVLVGNRPRYELPKVIAWLERKNGAKP